MKNYKSYEVGLEGGKGSLKYYKYWCGGIVLTTKKAVLKALNLELRTLRKDKITKDIEKFNHKNKRWEDV